MADIQGTTIQIIHGNDRGVGTVETICQGSSCGSINDMEDLEAGNLTGVLGRLSLSIVEVSGGS